MSLFDVAAELSRRLTRIFVRDEQGARPVIRPAPVPVRSALARSDSLLRILPRRQRRGLGASHQTGWTGLIAPLIDIFAGRCTRVPAGAGRESQECRTRCCCRSTPAPGSMSRAPRSRRRLARAAAVGARVRELAAEGALRPDRALGPSRLRVCGPAGSSMMRRVRACGVFGQGAKRRMSGPGNGGLSSAYRALRESEELHRATLSDSRMRCSCRTTRGRSHGLPERRRRCSATSLTRCMRWAASVACSATTCSSCRSSRSAERSAI